jgi:hypothetical protein
LPLSERDRPDGPRPRAAVDAAAGGDPATGAEHLARAWRLAPPVVVDVLRRYPGAPPGGGRPGELMRLLDAALR